MTLPEITANVAHDGTVTLIGDPRVRNLLASLPVLPKMHDQIDHAAAGLTKIIVSSCGRDFPKSEPAGTRITLNELAAVGRLAGRLKDQLDRLHKEAYDAIHADLSQTRYRLTMPSSLEKFKVDDPIGELKGELSSLNLAAKTRYFIVARDRMIPAKRGARPKHEAARITSAAANCFERLTGKKIARSIDPDSGEPVGEFHLFLEAIFALAAIKINVDEQIRGLVENVTRKNTINPI